MSKKFKNNIRPLSQRMGGAKEYKPPAEPPNLAAKFMRENPKGSLPDEDTPAMTLAGEPVSAAPAAAPAAAVEPTVTDPVVAPADAPAEAPRGATETLDAAAAALDAVAPPATPADAAGGSADVPPVIAPVEGAAAPVAPAVAAPVARDKYDPAEPIALLDGEAEWTRGDVVRGLQERATLQEEIEKIRPAIAERDQFLQVFGARDAKAALAQVEPFVRAIRENPERAKMLDAVAAMDPAELAYVQASIQEFRNAPVEQRAAWGQVGPTQTQTPTDPRYDALAKNQALLEERLITDRAKGEVTTILNDWPFLKADAKSWQAIQAVATAYWNEDEAKGIPPLQRRGYMEAIASQRPFLEHMKQAQERRVIAHASDAARPAAPSSLGPPPASAILPATHPQPPVAARPLVKKEYRGPVDGAAQAFLADLGYTK